MATRNDHDPASAPGERRLVIVRVFDAPRELVWKAFTEADRLAHWWGPAGFTTLVRTFDLRPGGVLHYAQRSPDGHVMWGKFVYRDIQAPERMVFVNSFADEDGNVIRAPFSPTWPLEILNIVMFTESEGKTTVTLRGGPLGATEEEWETFWNAQDSTRQGFAGRFDQLAAYLAKELGGTPMTTQNPPSTPVESGYAPVNGLQMYYEIHGSGQPLVLLHGNLSTIGTSFGKVLPALAATRRVIAVEQQGHGHTADIDRPFSTGQWAEDTTALLRHLNVEQADFFGYSSGGAVAVEIALRTPALVRKLVWAGGTSYRRDGLYPELLAGSETMQPDALDGTPFQLAYTSVAPHPEQWHRLVAKTADLDRATGGWPGETIASLEPPVLLIIGDSDIVRPEHVVEMFRLLGGGVVGDIVGLPRSQLAVLPGTTHVTLVDRAEWLTSMILAFLDAPMPVSGVTRVGSDAGR